MFDVCSLFFVFFCSVFFVIRRWFFDTCSLLLFTWFMLFALCVVFFVLFLSFVLCYVGLVSFALCPFCSLVFALCSLLYIPCSLSVFCCFVLVRGFVVCVLCR